jgi:hypothetical protein
MDTITCYLTFKFALERLLFTPCAQHLNGLLTMLKSHHIFDTQQCKNFHGLICPTKQESKSLETQFKSVSCKEFQAIFIGETSG